MDINGATMTLIKNYQWKPVSIVISNFNYAKFLESSIYSAIIQQDASIIVVDDCSTDESWDIIKKNVKQYKLIGIKLKENSKGNARGKNIGISISKSKYITCLDSDDMLLPVSVHNRLHSMKRYNVDLVHGKAIRVHSTDTFIDIYNKLNFYKRTSDLYNDIYNKRHENGFIRDLPENDINWYLGIEASTVLCYRSIYEKIGLYNEDLKWKIDREMWYRILYSKLFKKKFINDHVSIYRNHDNQITKNIYIKNPKTINKKFNNLIENMNSYVYTDLKSYNTENYISDIIL
jgi:glycosyltransferase involved in cell wall biosynthesis